MLNYKIDIFLKTARLLNISQTARELNISQPAVTAAIQRLEKEFGVKLFYRYPRGLELTEAGQLLNQRLLSLKESCIKLENEMMQLRKELHGHLLIGASPTVSDYILPRLMGTFSRHYPQVSYSLTTGNNSEVLRQLQEGKVELAFLAGNLPEQKLCTSKILDDELVLITAPDHPWASLCSLDTEELLLEPIILREQGSSSRRDTEEALAKIGLGLEQLKVIAVFESLEAIKNAVASGLGAALISRWAVAGELKMKKLHQVRVKGAALTRDINVVSLDENRLTGAAKLFLSFCQELPSKDTSDLL